jgi:hypothetical protein
MASAILSNALWRTDGVVSFQSTNASEAAFIAAFTSSMDESGAVAYTCPVDGLNTFTVFPLFAGTLLPFITLRNSFMIELLI